MEDSKAGHKAKSDPEALSTHQTMSTPKLGVLQLQTTFPRPPGDVSNPASWPFPITVGVVKEATATNVVGGTWGPELIDAFVREAERLQGEGCVALVTSCGFLATMHPQLSARVPFIGTSALLQVAWLQNTFYPGQQHAVGVMTFKRSALVSRYRYSGRLLTSDGEAPRQRRCRS